MSPVPTDPQLQRSVQQPWIARISRIGKVLISSAVAVFVFVCGGVLDWLVRHQYLAPIFLMWAGAAVASAMGLLVFTAMTEVQKRYQVLVQRLQRIAELNQHIRDALQIILFANVPERSAQAIKQVNTAVIRIESVLREQVPASGSGPFWRRFFKQGSRVN